MLFSVRLEINIRVSEEKSSFTGVTADDKWSPINGSTQR
jgi:hypothetical protein